MSYCCFEVIRGNDMGRRYRLSVGATSFGRNASNTIKLSTAERSVSNHHCIVYVSPGRILIQDLQSTNGTYVNEEKIQEKEIISGDVLGFGKTGPRLRCIESEEELPLRAALSDTPVPRVSGRTTDDIDMPKPQTADPSDTDETPVDVSATGELEHRLMADRATDLDVRRILSDKKLLNKIEKRGKIGDGRTRMLKTAYAMRRENRKRWYFLFAFIGFTAVAVLCLMATKAVQYRRILNESLALEGRLDVLDRQLAHVKSDSTSSQRLDSLVSLIELTQSRYDKLRSNVKSKDQSLFYAHPAERRIDEVMHAFGEQQYHIPPEMAEAVKGHLATYSGPLKPTIQRYLKRRLNYYPEITKVFRENNLPEELAYVAMLESGYNPQAKSAAGAVGLWQFMPGTARDFGMTVSPTQDDRLDPARSTRAAAEYFKDLIAIFGSSKSVMLAMAAYNAGEGRVIAALRKIEDPVNDRDFWHLYRIGCFAEETREYIPRVIALIIISKHPEEYGFATVSASNNASEPPAENDFVDFRARSKPAITAP
jgi:pSer/pThr/pTyr-binding forkhead associated (FHA) protein